MVHGYLYPPSTTPDGSAYLLQQPVPEKLKHSTARKRAMFAKGAVPFVTQRVCRHQMISPYLTSSMQVL